MLNQKERAESRAICDAATGKKWASKNGQIYSPLGTGDLLKIGGGFDLNDAVFVAHARTALPAALDALDEMEDFKEWMSNALM